MTVGWSVLQFAHQKQVSPPIRFLQWVCRSCGSSTSMQDILASPRFHVLFVGPNDGGSPSSNSCSTGACSSTRQKTDWFSHGPLTRFASLCGWARGDPTTPCNATQSCLALHCPSISLGFALAETRMGVFPCSTGISDFVTRNNGQVLSRINLGLPTHSLSSVQKPHISFA